MGTPLYRSLAVEDVSLRALAHGMARDRFDGDDVIKVKRRIAEAVERARTTGEPTLVEVVTYRFRGHSMSDPGLYRTKDEVEEWKRRDPLNRSRARLLDARVPRGRARLARGRREGRDRGRGEVRRGLARRPTSTCRTSCKEYVTWRSSAIARRSTRRCARRWSATPNVFIMGEEVGHYNGAYKVTQGLLQRFCERRVDRRADRRDGLRRHRHRRGDGRAAADHRVHDVQLLARRDRSDRQQRGEDLSDERRAVSRADRVPRPGRPGGAGRLAAQPVARELLRARARPQGRDAVDRVRREGPPQDRDPRRQPGRVHRGRDALQHDLGGPRRRRRRRADPDRQGPTSSARARTSR